MICSTVPRVSTPCISGRSAGIQVHAAVNFLTNDQGLRNWISEPRKNGRVEQKKELAREFSWREMRTTPRWSRGRLFRPNLNSLGSSNPGWQIVELLFTCRVVGFGPPKMDSLRAWIPTDPPVWTERTGSRAEVVTVHIRGDSKLTG